jgi:leucyl aminopeptidase (aminopeptidase T)
LVGISIAEFAMGANDWAVLDNNISNCEKVAGTVHFGMGQTVANIGVNRGEKFHFDSMVTTASVTAIGKNGRKTRLIEKGKLLI